MLDTYANNNSEHFQALHSRRHHDPCLRRHSIPLPATLPSSPMLYQSPVDTHSNDSQTYYTSTSKHSSTIELLLSRLLDAVIFTSAIALTAYNYWSGTLDQEACSQTATPPTSSSSEIFTSRAQQNQHSPLSSSSTIAQQHHHHHHHSPYHHPYLHQSNQLYPQPYSLASSRPDNESIITIRRTDPLDDARQKRTQEWAEAVRRQLMKPSSKLVMPSSSTSKQRHKKKTRRERRSHSLDLQLARVQTEVVKQKEEEKEEEREGEATKLSDSEETKEIEDEMLARMEEQLQNLIQEGQAALSSIPEIEDMDEKEMAMRHAFSKRYST